jgi:hypothetical protein
VQGLGSIPSTGGKKKTKQQKNPYAYNVYIKFENIHREQKTARIVLKKAKKILERNT